MLPSITEAIVLRSREFQEADRLVTLFSPDIGKFTGIAKHAKKSVRRFGPLLESPLLLQVHFKEKRNHALFFLEKVALQQGFPGLFQDLKRIATAWYFLEMVDLLTVEKDPSPGIFGLLKTGILSLEKEGSSSILVGAFQYELLKLAGFAPTPDHCLHCHLREHLPRPSKSAIFLARWPELIPSHQKN
ncbi:MAG: DNA repair protein RecO [Deltaproteobacteria bacterium]|nr:DNA repair protein RecO [Deltaproteobacteria bacterium]